VAGGYGGNMSIEGHALRYRSNTTRQVLAMSGDSPRREKCEYGCGADVCVNPSDSRARQSKENHVCLPKVASLKSAIDAAFDATNSAESSDSLERAAREKEVQAARDWYDAKYKDNVYHHWDSIDAADFTRDCLDAQRKEIVRKLRALGAKWYDERGGGNQAAILDLKELADAIEGGKERDNVGR
jgi:hypothetical protein